MHTFNHLNIICVVATALIDHKCVKISVFNQCIRSCGITLSDDSIFVLSEAFKNPIKFFIFFICFVCRPETSKLFFVTYL